MNSIENNKRHIEYINKSIVKKNSNDINRYKVYIPENGGSGNDGIVLVKPEISNNDSVCSQSYLYSVFDTKNRQRIFTNIYKLNF